MFGVQRLAVTVRLARLLRGQIMLPKVDLEAPTINRERDLKGRGEGVVASFA